MDKPPENVVVLPVTVPAGVGDRLGYAGCGGYVMAYWEPAIDKPVLDDGQASPGGMAIAGSTST
ncbi:MAG: hypothetical protein M5U01_40395 [Ardenticatenaceae bacterium]|nr:hypothetical protein [Ardenticatenaceae bacterium]